MELPPKIINQYIFVSGGGYRGYKQYPHDKSPKKRFFFILNQFPEKDDKIVIVTSTSQVQKTVRLHYCKTYVIIEPHEYSPFMVTSAINCGFADIRSKVEIERDLRNKEIEIIKPLPNYILNKCKESIRQSPTTTNEISRLVFGDEKVVDEPAL